MVYAKPKPPSAGPKECPEDIAPVVEKPKREFTPPEHLTRKPFKTSAMYDLKKRLERES